MKIVFGQRKHETKQVLYIEPEGLSYGWSAQHERETSASPGGGETKGPVMEDLKSS